MSTTSPSSPEIEVSGNTGLIKEWLLRFATNSGQPLDDGRVALWRDEFSKVEPGLLDCAFREVMRGHTFNCIPTVGEVWAQLGEARRTESLEARQVAHERWLSAQPPWEELRRRGRDYCERVRAYTQEIAELQKRARSNVVPEPIVIATPERLAELEEQKRQILARYPRSAEPEVREE